MALLFKDIFAGSKPVNGELTINLNLTIKIEADGSLSVSPSVATTQQAPQQQQPVRNLPPKAGERIEYTIPDINVDEGSLIDFGKNV